MTTPTPQLQLTDFKSFLTDLNEFVREWRAIPLGRVWAELVSLVVILEATVGIEGLFLSSPPPQVLGERFIRIRHARSGICHPLRGPFADWIRQKGILGKALPTQNLLFCMSGRVRVDLEWSRKALVGLSEASPISGTWFDPTMSDNEIHLALLQLVTQDNSRNHVAARFQSYPDRVEKLLGPDSDSAQQGYLKAVRGLVRCLAAPSCTSTVLTA
jgi:hypothetical protein